MTKGKLLLFAHGFNIRFGFIKPPADVDVRWSRQRRRGIACARSLPKAAAYRPCCRGAGPERQGAEVGAELREGIGCTRAGVLETTFTEETETDLFGEQAVLCGGTSALVKAGFETLVEAGYQPELAYFECLHELKLIVDLMYRGGLEYMRHSISDTAEWGDYVAGPRIVTDQTRAEMKKLLAEIQDGSFARKFMEENRTGRHQFEKYRTEERGSLDREGRKPAAGGDAVPRPGDGRIAVASLAGGRYNRLIRPFGTGNWALGPAVDIAGLPVG